MSHTLIVGRTGCGKTHYLTNSLKKNSSGIYTSICLVCPTFSINKTRQNWEYKQDRNFHVIETHDVNVAIQNIIKHETTVVKQYPGAQALVILDDVASSKDVKAKSSELVKLGFSGRHLGLSVIVITQQLTSIAKAYRENVSKLVTFYTPGKNDMKVIVDEYLDDEANPIEIRKTLRDVPYARLEILLCYPYGHKVIV